MLKRIFVFTLILFKLSLGLALEQSPANWSYTGPQGAQAWPSLFPECARHKQSPIDIPSLANGDAPQFVIHYNPGDFKLVQKNGNIYAYYTGDAKKNYVKLGLHKYYLSQIHFHTPAEHTHIGVQNPMEVHFVNIDEKQQALAVGVWLKLGSENKFLNQMLNAQTQNQEQMVLNPKEFIPFLSKFYFYEGSLTTPPCAPVKWILLKKTATVSQAQIERFQKNVTADNARPLQPKGSRTIKTGYLLR